MNSTALTPRRTRQIARTAVYRLVFGEAKTGLGVDDPTRDGRKKPHYDYGQFHDAVFDVKKLLPECQFDEAKVLAIQAQLNALRPNRAGLVDLIGKPTIDPSKIDQSEFDPESQPTEEGFHAWEAHEAAEKNLPRKPKILPALDATAEKPKRTRKTKTSPEIAEVVEPPKKRTRAKKIAQAAE